MDKSSETTHQVTALLHAWRAGNAAAGETLISRIYDDLRRMARVQLRREYRAMTLDPTALVHECFLRLVHQESRINDRVHFFAMAATMMRRVLVDQARARLADKRRHVAVSLTTAVDLAELGGLGGDGSGDPALIDLDQALARLALEHPRQARVVEMRFFAGLTEVEIAEALGVADRTVKRDWAFARAWLLTELQGLSG
jgi:RNA polymerase sigma factor (TIGR02999 family)